MSGSTRTRNNVRTQLQLSTAVAIWAAVALSACTGSIGGGKGTLAVSYEAAGMTQNQALFDANVASISAAAKTCGVVPSTDPFRVIVLERHSTLGNGSPRRQAIAGKSFDETTQLYARLVPANPASTIGHNRLCNPNEISQLAQSIAAIQRRDFTAVPALAKYLP